MRLHGLSVRICAARGFATIATRRSSRAVAMQSFVLTLASNGHIESALRLISITVRKRSISVTANGSIFSWASNLLDTRHATAAICFALTIREASMAETQKQPGPKHARFRNGMAHRLERIERDVADIKAALVTKSMAQQPTVPPMAKQTARAIRR
jgi:hypothetical protein